MPRRVTAAEAVAAVARFAAKPQDRTVFVGVDGFGAAGKSTLAARIAAALARATVVHVDDFAGPDVAEWDFARFDAQLVTPLLADEAARYQVWDWERNVGAEWRTVAPGALVVVEGVSSTRAEVRLPWDLTIWVDAPRDLRLARALARDGDALMPRWLQDWMPSEEAYAARELPEQRVDLLVCGADVPESATV